MRKKGKPIENEKVSKFVTRDEVRSGAKFSFGLDVGGKNWVL